MLLHLQLVDVPLTKVECVADQLLAVKAGHHSVLKRFFVAEQLTEHSAQLEVIFTQVTQFEQLARYVELLELLLGREREHGPVPPSLRQVVGHGRNRVVAKGVVQTLHQERLGLASLRHHIQELFVFFEIGNFLFEVVDGAVEVTGAVGEHVESLVAARLVVEDHNDQVAVDFAALGGDELEHLLAALQRVQGRLRLFVLQVHDRFVVDLG